MRQHQEILQFLEVRKEDYLKKHLKASFSEEQRLVVQSDAQTQFKLTNWLPAASIRAKQLSLVTHPAKFSHSGAKNTTAVIAHSLAKNDGFLRTGNVPNLPCKLF